MGCNTHMQQKRVYKVGLRSHLLPSSAAPKPEKEYCCLESAEFLEGQT